MKTLLYSPQYRPNLSNIVRSAEFFGLKEIYIYDTNNLLKPPTSKNERANFEHMARVWTAGALDHVTINHVNNVKEWLASQKGRSIATVLNDKATPLKEFQFQEDDIVIFGPEKEGLPKEILELCDEQITIATKGHTDSLNVSVFFGIILNQALPK